MLAWLKFGGTGGTNQPTIGGGCGRAETQIVSFFDGGRERKKERRRELLLLRLPKTDVFPKALKSKFFKGTIM